MSQADAAPPMESTTESRRPVYRPDLLEAAVAAIREHGPGVSMEQLARQGGVTKPILYRHFGDRDGLIAAIADHFTTGLLSQIDMALHRSAEPRELLETTIDAYLAFVEGDTALYRFLLHQADTSRDNLSKISPLVDVVAREVALVIGEQLAELGRDAGAAVPFAYGIVGFVHQAGDWWLGNGALPRADLTRYLTTLLWDGLDRAVGGAES